MIRINLLPFRAARKRENIKRQITVYCLSVALLLVAMIYTFIYLNSSLADAKQEQKSINNDLKKYEETIKIIDELDKKIRLIEDKLEVIKKLEKGKTGPVRLLDEIAMAVPKNKLWLDSLTESRGNLALKGTARDNETVADFMVNLDKTISINAVDLQSIQAVIQEGRSLSKFTLNCETYAHIKEDESGKKGKKKRKK
jgi:type IV pilus assembly protein PilN